MLSVESLEDPRQAALSFHWHFWTGSGILGSFSHPLLVRDFKSSSKLWLTSKPTLILESIAFLAGRFRDYY